MWDDGQRPLFSALLSLSDSDVGSEASKYRRMDFSGSWVWGSGLVMVSLDAEV